MYMLFRRSNVSQVTLSLRIRTNAMRVINAIRISVKGRPWIWSTPRCFYVVAVVYRQAAVRACPSHPCPWVRSGYEPGRSRNLAHNSWLTWFFCTNPCPVQDHDQPVVLSAMPFEWIQEWEIHCGCALHPNKLYLHAGMEGKPSSRCNPNLNKSALLSFLIPVCKLMSLIQK